MEEMVRIEILFQDRMSRSCKDLNQKLIGNIKIKLARATLIYFGWAHRSSVLSGNIWYRNK